MRVIIEFYIVVAILWTLCWWYNNYPFKTSFIMGFTWLFDILYDFKNNIFRHNEHLSNIPEMEFYENYYMITDSEGKLHKPTLRDIDYHIFEVMEKDGFKGF